MASYLGVTELSLPQDDLHTVAKAGCVLIFTHSERNHWFCKELRTFIGSVTLGNPLFIRESIGQLMEGHIKVDAQPGAQLKRLECGDLTQAPHKRAISKEIFSVPSVGVCKSLSVRHSAFAGGEDVGYDSSNLSRSLSSLNNMISTPCKLA
eukprot:4179216-Amphidinium_carterae.1